jgi:hypothetical protein
MRGRSFLGLVVAICTSIVLHALYRRVTRGHW